MLYGILIPLLGTALGAACVFFMKRSLHLQLQRALTGFAAGVMVAASIWSLLIPAIEQAAAMGTAAVLPAVAGFWLGILFLLLLDRIIPHLHQNSEQPEGVHAGFSRTTMMLLAVALSLGMAIQNFPEGAIISMPLHAEGMQKNRAFAYGVLSGVLEPLAALLTIWAARFVVPALPYFLSFAAGAMLYVVVEELIPEMSAGKHSNIGTIFFATGFSLMMVLDVMLG